MTDKNKNARSSGFNISFIIIPVLLLVIMGVLVLNGGILGKSSSANVVKDSDLVIKLDEVTETAKFYPVVMGGTKLEVLAVKAPDGTVRTAFNTCQVCYASGRGYYKQEGSELVCQNCGNRFGMEDVEVTRGGCNPVPITEDYKTVNDEEIVISKDFLNEAKIIFSNWKN